MSLNAEIADAYGATGEAWQRGPARVYNRLADVLVASSPIPLTRARVLDVGAGTGAATRAARVRGADVVALDIATAMLAADAADRPAAVTGDALSLPFVDDAFDVLVAAFSMNHLVDPVAGLTEAARVVRRDGAVLVSAYGADDGHPVRDAVNGAAAARGWTPPPWASAVSERAVPRLATVERACAVAVDAGLAEVVSTDVRVTFPELTSADLVAWRLGMAQLAPFVATLSSADVDGLVDDALSRLGDAPVLERSMIVLSGRVR